MMIPTYAFVLIAVVLAIIIGRTGTILRDYIETRNTSYSKEPSSETQHTVKRLWRV